MNEAYGGPLNLSFQLELWVVKCMLWGENHSDSNSVERERESVCVCVCGVFILSVLHKDLGLPKPLKCLAFIDGQRAFPSK